MSSAIQQPYLPLKGGDIFFVIHCFFHCKTIIRDIDCQRAHDRMEEHYQQAHRKDMENVLAYMGVRERNKR